MVRLENVTKTYGTHTALHSTNLEFGRGTTTALIGPSGCGKSTVLRLIIGLIAPSAGTVLVDGKAVRNETTQALRRRCGYVIQEGGLFPHLTARANVALMARELRWSADDIAARTKELCELTSLAETLLDRYPSELSGGQRQRVSLMRALMLRPELLLLDEPLGALDPMVRAALQDDLKSIFARVGQTVILVTHDLAEAAHLGERIVLMNGGRVVQEGTLADLRERPADAFVTQFVNAQRSLSAA